MTAEQLRQKMNDEYGNYNLPWPDSIEVDKDTFINVILFLFDTKSIGFSKVQHQVQLQLGKNNSVLFKGVELLLKKEKID